MTSISDPRLSALDQEIDNFLDGSLMSPSELQERHDMLNELQSILQFGVLRPFGSFLTGLGNSNSDLDVYFQDHDGKDPTFVLNIVHSLLTELKLNGNGSCYSKKMEILNEVRVPVLRFTPMTYPTLKIDLSFQNEQAVQNSKWIHFLFKLNPVLRPLIIILREWARSRRLLKVKAFKSYAIVLLSISLLVRRKELPSLSLLQSLVPPQLNSDGHWNINFSTDEEAVKSRMIEEGIGNSSISRATDLIPFVLEFFDMVENELTSDVILCTASGEFLPRLIFRHGKEHLLPKSQAPFVQMKKRLFPERWRFGQFPSNREMCIQDPFDLSQNVSEFCSSLNKIKQAIEETREKLVGEFLQVNPFKELFPIVVVPITNHVQNPTPNPSPNSKDMNQNTNQTQNQNNNKIPKRKSLKRLSKQERLQRVRAQYKLKCEKVRAEKTTSNPSQDKNQDMNQNTNQNRNNNKIPKRKSLQRLSKQERLERVRAQYNLKCEKVRAEKKLQHE